LRETTFKIAPHVHQQTIVRHAIAHKYSMGISS